MAVLGIKDPTITDTIVFNIDTPDANGCFSANPYMVNRAIIFFVERSFTSGNNRFYQDPAYDEAKVQDAVQAEAIACMSPTPPNIDNAKRLRSIADSSAVLTDVYFNQAKPVAVIGTDDFPAWLSTDVTNAQIVNQPLDALGNTQYGRFTLTWEPKGEIREGNYFICWTWEMQPAGDAQSANMSFTLGSDTSVTTSIPTHHTIPDKYDTLLERYLPQTFKDYLAKGDLTPDVMDKLNHAIAKGFTQLEDLANQVIDLYDANSVNETFLPFLSNLFNLKLKSGDPTLWRRQVKEAIPTFKKKGTLGGLKDAMAQAGMEVKKYTPLWQIISRYTWVDSFKVQPAQTEFVLSKVALSYDPKNFELTYRPKGSGSYTVLDPSYVTFNTSAGVTTMTWAGTTNSTPIALSPGDVVKILYLYAQVPGSTEQLLEEYVRTLDTADQRDENAQMYPVKNWNVKVLEQDDPLFDMLITERHPFHEDLIFGYIRTEFPYSENIYNMDEYNGSTRPSKNPCDIAKDFQDPCSNGISSKFILDVEIQELSNDTLSESMQVVTENAPFHSVLHRMNASGAIYEFLADPVEEVECLVTYVINDVVISGEANSQFYRIMDYPNGPKNVKRVLLANSTEVISEQTGIVFNDNVVLYCPTVRFDSLPLEPTNVVEVFSPSANAGLYTLSNPYKNTAQVTTVSEPINETAFTFRLSDNVYFNPSTVIAQSNLTRLSDAKVDFLAFSLKTQWDVSNGYLGAPWSVQLPYGTFTVVDMAQDGSLILDDPGNALPSSNQANLTYTVLDGSGVPQIEGTNTTTGTNGVLRVTPRGKVTMNDVSLPDVRMIIQKNDYLLYGGTQYLISGFLPGSTTTFYIDGYSAGNAGGVPAYVYRRLVDSAIGYFQYRGINLQAFFDVEQNLGIDNGANGSPPDDWLENDKFKENYLVLINDDFYLMEQVNVDIITLGGPMRSWRTQPAGGSVVAYSIYQFSRTPIFLADEYFKMDRRGSEGSSEVIHEDEFIPYFYTGSGGISTSGAADDEITSLHYTAKGSGGVGVGGQATAGASGGVAFGPILAAINEGGSTVSDSITHSETVSYTIEYADGSIHQGEIQ
jgi:hypothetical protein